MGKGGKEEKNWVIYCIDAVVFLEKRYRRLKKTVVGQWLASIRRHR